MGISLQREHLAYVELAHETGSRRMQAIAPFATHPVQRSIDLIGNPQGSIFDNVPLLSSNTFVIKTNDASSRAGDASSSDIHQLRAVL